MWSASHRTADACPWPEGPSATSWPAQGRRLRSVIADNILDRQFTAEAPNQRWIADFTYIWTAEGWLYIAVVIDLFSRCVV
ncbi:hypothetical protein HMP09_3262 [Sphingomonas sp. HMP9]|nr:hypothetical protein HMP09_3262 [Sphingomonas sp. HMP9]